MNHNQVLHEAVMYGDIKAIEYSLRNGADIESKNKHGETALHVAVLAKSTKSIDYLIKSGANINAMDIDGLTPLHSAIIKNDYGLIKGLVPDGVNIDSIIDKYGYTPLSYALSYESILDKMSYLLISLGSNIHHKDNRGFLPIHCAASCGRIDVLKTLIKLGASVSAIDKNGNSSLHFAALNENINMMQELLKYKPDFNKNNDGQTPIELALYKGKMKAVDFLNAYTEQEQLNIKITSDIEKQDSQLSF